MFLFIIILGFANNSLETNCNIGASVGINNCSDRSRLEFTYRNYLFAQIHEVGVTIFSGRGMQYHSIDITVSIQHTLFIY